MHLLVSIIFSVFKSKNIWTLLKLYTTYVRPKLEYATCVWSPYLKKDIAKIESIQKRFTKYAFLRSQIPFSSYNDRLLKINIKSLQYRRIVFNNNNKSVIFIRLIQYTIHLST